MTHYLYWLHTPEHTNVLLEGYVGVSKNIKKRFYRHRKTTENPHLLRAFEKYPTILQTILMKGDKYFCYEMEKKMRPVEQIGWNIAPGGKKPPSMLGKKWPKHSIRIGKNHPMWGKKCPWIVEHNINKAKDWIVINPQGAEIKVRNLRKFCRENNLEHSHLGQRGRYKGWKCERVV